MGNYYPYTNFHELNADWMIEEVTNLKRYLRERLEKVFVECVYDSDTETLVLTLTEAE